MGAGSNAMDRSAAGVRQRRGQDPPLVRWGLTLMAVGVISLLIVVPVVSVFARRWLGGHWSTGTTWWPTPIRGAPSG